MVTGINVKYDREIVPENNVVEAISQLDNAIDPAS